MGGAGQIVLVPYTRYRDTLPLTLKTKPSQMLFVTCTLSGKDIAGKKAWHFEEHSREKKEQTLSFLACMCWMFQPLKSTTIYWRVSYSISIAGHLLLSNILLPSMGRAWDGVQQDTFWKYILIRSGKCVLCTKKNGLVNIRSYCQTP